MFSFLQPQKVLVIAPFYGAQLSLYCHPLKHLDCQFHEILFVGDDWINDVEVPMKFGFETVLIDRRCRMNNREGLRNLESILPFLTSSC